MPLFEYRCQGCGKEFEELIRREEDEKDVKCPECGSADNKKLMSADSPIAERWHPTTPGKNFRY